MTTPRRPDRTPHTLETIYVKCIDDGGCWIWQGGLGHGSPMLSHERKPIPVRRYIAGHILGKKTKGLTATVTCMNQLCVCPDHIVMMTRGQLQKYWHEHLRYTQNPVRNSRIAEAKRAQSPYGEDIVEQVRELSETLSQRAIARALNLNFDFVNKIVNGKSRRTYTANVWAGLM